MMKKQLMKVKKQFADQTFLRGEKSNDVIDDLEIASKRVDCIKNSCQIIQKKIAACLQSANETLSTEKRKKKIAAFSLGSQLSELGSSNFGDFSVLGSALIACGPIQTGLAEELLAFECQVEITVLNPLSQLLEVDIPNVIKMKKTLSKLNADMESAKSKHETAFRHLTQTGGVATTTNLAKMETAKEEYEEIAMKVEQQRDALCGEMFALLSREPEISRIFLQWYTLQADYHSRVVAALETDIPKLQAIIANNQYGPVYGCPLEEHLRVTSRQVATVIENCVCALIDVALKEEGLFRIAGSASKVKKLKSAFDAGILTMSDYVTDPHCIAGALKSYLRELPEPLLTCDLYEEWIQANSQSDHDNRMQKLWQVVNKLPEHNTNNLKYLVKFLSKLSSYCEHNKMSSLNLAIVMAPNLIWTPQALLDNSQIGLNMTVANMHSAIVETLIAYSDWFFPGEIDFYITSLPLPPPTPTPPPPNEPFQFPHLMGGGIDNSAFANGDLEPPDPSTLNPTSNTSPTSSHSPRIVHRPGKKPAPPAPPLVGGTRATRPPKLHVENPILRASSVDRHVLERAQTVADISHAHFEPTRPPGELATPPIMTRSATLDRPGKPKRNSLRQSNDNLAEPQENKMAAGCTKSLNRPTKPVVPAKPSSVTMVTNDIEQSDMKPIVATDTKPVVATDIKPIVAMVTPVAELSRKLSMGGIQFVDDSDEDPVAVATVTTSNFDKKWDFLTGGAANKNAIKPPERPPRTVVAVATEDSDEDKRLLDSLIAWAGDEAPVVKATVPPSPTGSVSKRAMRPQPPPPPTKPKMNNSNEDTRL